MAEEHANNSNLPSDEVWEGLSDEDRRIINAYLSTAVPVDFLAYTEHFDRLYERLQGEGETRSKADIFRRLLNLRKRGQLPRMFRSAS
jgi:TRAP-type C4-dicarboxylate transport system substrate-binding protein